MSTTTPRLGLYKTASDGSENVNVVTDLLNNWDALDLAIGARVVTSTTRPSTPYAGQSILESDTGYRTLVSNGTSPASGGWIEIPNNSALYGGQINASRATDGNTFKAANTFAGGNTNPSVLTEHAAATAISYGSRVAGDTFDRIRIRADGRIDIGSGSAARDVNLYRSAADTLRTDDSIHAPLMASAYVETTTGAIISGTSYAAISSPALSATAVVPPSGRLEIYGSIRQDINAGHYAFSSFNVAGSVSGSLRAPSDSFSLTTGASVYMQACGSLVVRVSSANVGETVTVTWQHKVDSSGGAANIYSRSIGITPLLG